MPVIFRRKDLSKLITKAYSYIIIRIHVIDLDCFSGICSFKLLVVTDRKNAINLALV
jgi:hypothetical protein